MTEIAARVCKLLLRKTIQDILMEIQQEKNEGSLKKPIDSLKGSRSRILNKHGEIDIT